METSTITRDGRTICFHTTGRNDASRCVVFVHPSPGSGAFDPDPDQTSKRDVLLIGVDLPADDIGAVVDHLGYATAGVAGWSTGGLIALDLAARRPDLVDRLVLLGTPALNEDASLEFEPADVQAKTLLLYGYDDTTVRPADARWWKDNLANSRIEMMPGVGHDIVVPAWKRVLSHLAPGTKS